MTQRHQMLNGGTCAGLIGILTLRHRRLRFDIQKQHRLAAAQQLDLLRFIGIQRQVNQQPIDPLSQQFIHGGGRIVAAVHRNHQMITRPRSTLLNRRGDLRRCHQGQVAGRET